MSRHYKDIRNGQGTNLTIGPDDRYISIGPDGKDIMIGCKDEVLAFDSFEDMVKAIDISKTSYYHKDDFIKQENISVVKDAIKNGIQIDYATKDGSSFKSVLSKEANEGLHMIYSAGYNAKIHKCWLHFDAVTKLAYENLLKYADDKNHINSKDFYEKTGTELDEYLTNAAEFIETTYGTGKRTEAHDSDEMIDLINKDDKAAYFMKTVGRDYLNDIIKHISEILDHPYDFYDTAEELRKDFNRLIRCSNRIGADCFDWNPMLDFEKELLEQDMER